MNYAPHTFGRDRDYQSDYRPRNADGVIGKEEHATYTPPRYTGYYTDSVRSRHSASYSIRQNHMVGSIRQSQDHSRQVRYWPTFFMAGCVAASAFIALL